MIKKIKFFIFIFIILTLLTACSKNKEVLNIYNWGDYLDTDIIKEFEKEFNVKVNYMTFASNEDMYIAIKKGGTNYDVVFPSDYMIERMRKEGLLEKLDKNIIKNKKYIDKNLMYKEFDPKNDYSLPYYWGTVGIVYNKKYIKESEVSSWDILWNPKYKNEVFMLDSQRDAFAIALKRLGYSMNSTDLNELNEAKDELIKQKEIVYAYVGDEIKDLMIAEEAYLGVVWSGDAIGISNENKNIEYSIPKEGTNLWFDSIVIPKNAKNKKMANEFINFLNRPEIAAKNADYIEYPVANKEAKKYMSKEMKKNPIAYPSKEILENSETFKDPKEMLQVYSDLWIDVKASNNRK